ncbi:PIN domain-containing protein [Spirillospora albida]|uniref:PIN domain-containing protein n=1 Tax=Spirillospora albida TaxID=58123 RepID=UPI0004BEE728|nr:PIN domain-containing protein [Spirillospora albida]
MTSPRPSVPAGLSGRVLDTPAIVDLATGRSRYMRAVAYIAASRGETLAVPAVVLAEASAAVADEAARDLLRRAVDSEIILVMSLTAADAISAGELGGKLRLSLPAAHVALAAAARRWPIITRAEDAETWRNLGYAVDVLP